MNGLKMPFRAVPVQLGQQAHAKLQREQRQRYINTVITIALIALPVFVVGMIVTNMAIVGRYLPSTLFDATNGTRPASTYFPNCSAARATGHTPIHAGSPGYRIGLDADGDGIACEPSIDP